MREIFFVQNAAHDFNRGFDGCDSAQTILIGYGKNG